MSKRDFETCVSGRCSECGDELQARSEKALHAVMARHRSVTHRILSLPKRGDRYRAFRSAHRSGQSRYGALLEPRGSGSPESRVLDVRGALATIASTGRSGG